MKWPFFIGVLWFLVSCGQSPDLSIAQAGDPSNLTKDTLILNGQKLIVYQESTRPQFLLTSAGDTILTKAEYYHQLDTIDINRDGYTDLRVYIISNTPNQCENYFFDNTNNHFRKIQNCDLNITRLNDADLYYSYNRAGCSDMNWESHLSRIEEYDLINIGYMNGQGCEDKPTQQKIDIFKVVPPIEKETLIKSLPYLINIPCPEDKWNFIHSYWEKNHKLFNK